MRGLPLLLLLGLPLVGGCYDLTGLGTNRAPDATITSHEDGDAEPADVLVTLRGIVSDEDDRFEELTVSWWQDDARICGPTAASAQGDTTCAMTFSPGDARVVLEVRDTGGSGASDRVDLVIGGAGDDDAGDDDAGDDDAGDDDVGDDDVGDDDTTVGDDDTGVGDDDTAAGDDDTSAGDDDVGDDDTAGDDDAVNLPPSQPTVAIQPAAPTEGDDLVAFISTVSQDPEGAFVTYRYEWSNGGSPLPLLTTSIVPAAETTAGETWTVVVTPTDGTLDGPGALDSVSIAADPVTSPCSLPPYYSRITHTQGNIDFKEVAWAPDGDHALIVGHPGQLYRFDAATDALTEVGDGDGEYWYGLGYDEDGDYAVVAGATWPSAGNPKVYLWTAAGGLVELVVPTLGNGRPPDPGRIMAIDQLPGTDTWALWSDNGSGSGNPIAYINELDVDIAGGNHAWTFGGAINISQQASSIAWGTRFGQWMAVGVSTYTDMLWYEPYLASNQLSRESVTNTGNLNKVVFDPLDTDRAWILSGTSVAPWEGSYGNGGSNYYSFPGFGLIDFAVDEFGIWRLFVGRSGRVVFADGSWDSPPSANFSDQDIPGWTSAPWNGGSNDFLHAVAFRPGTCEALMVGDATAGQGLLVHAQLQ